MTEHKLDVYLLKAYEKGFVVLDGDYILTTDIGKLELNNIASACISLIDSNPLSLNLIKDASKAVAKAIGKEVTSLELFKKVLLTMESTEARLLVFLMYEQDSDFNDLKASLANSKLFKKAELSVVPRNKKYDN